MMQILKPDCPLCLAERWTEVEIYIDLWASAIRLRSQGLEETGLGDWLKGSLKKSYTDGPLRVGSVRISVSYKEAY